MPQLDMSTWLITIISMILALFTMMQLKVSKHAFHSNPEPLEVESSKHTAPWETKGTKIYSPLSLPQR